MTRISPIGKKHLRGVRRTLRTVEELRLTSLWRSPVSWRAAIRGDWR